MSYMYQKNLDLVYSTSEDTRKANGRITHQKMQTLKSLSAKKAPQGENPVCAFSKFLSAAFCFLFRPRLANEAQATAKPRIISENSTAVYF